MDNDSQVPTWSSPVGDAPDGDRGGVATLYAEPVAGAADSWSALFEDRWLAFSGIHGGSVVATLVRAAELATGAPAATVSAHLHSPAHPGTVALTTSVSASSRTITSVSVTATPDSPIATALVLLSPALGAAQPRQHQTTFGPTGTEADPDSVPPLHLPSGINPMSELFHIRPIGPSRPLAAGPYPRLSAWIATRRPSNYSAGLAVTLLDVLAPGLWATLDGPIPIPTVELSVHLTGAAPASEWYVIDQATTWSDAALCVDTSELFDAEGTLLAQARQLRRILRPRPVGHSL
jgi:hypothetical protein